MLAEHPEPSTATSSTERILFSTTSHIRVTLTPAGLNAYRIACVGHPTDPRDSGGWATITVEELLKMHRFCPNSNLVASGMELVPESVLRVKPQAPPAEPGKRRLAVTQDMLAEAMDQIGYDTKNIYAWWQMLTQLWFTLESLQPTPEQQDTEESSIP